MIDPVVAETAHLLALEEAYKWLSGSFGGYCSSRDPTRLSSDWWTRMLGRVDLEGSFTDHDGSLASETRCWSTSCFFSKSQKELCLVLADYLEEKGM
jgi:hypothetical protein